MNSLSISIARLDWTKVLLVSSICNSAFRIEASQRLAIPNRSNSNLELSLLKYQLENLELHNLHSCILILASCMG